MNQQIKTCQEFLRELAADVMWEGRPKKPEVMFRILGWTFIRGLGDVVTFTDGGIWDFGKSSEPIQMIDHNGQPILSPNLRGIFNADEPVNVEFDLERRLVFAYHKTSLCSHSCI